MTSTAMRLGWVGTGERMRTGERMHPTRAPRRPSGIAYLFLLLAIATLAVGAGASLQLGTAATRWAAQQQLLAVGGEFERALRSYANVPLAGPVPPGTHGPRSLEELLRDPRVPGVQRHLRQVYADPLTGQRTWGLERDPQGHILAVYSLAPDGPVRPPADPDAPSGGRQPWKFGLLDRSAPLR